MQHNYTTQDTAQDNTENSTENSTENRNTEQENREQRTEYSTYDLHKYSLDYYHEYVSIKNSNTIELYTILQDKI